MENNLQERIHFEYEEPGLIPVEATLSGEAEYERWTFAI
jgi:hypothetical protein